MTTQPQLIPIALNPRDVVYTPDSVARDIVAYFKPSGRILEPCCGDGAFLKYLPPDTEWCEIEHGRDFFAEHRHFDWIVGNPPFSNYYKWMLHAFQLAINVVYIFPLNKIFQSYRNLLTIREYGGVVTNYVLGNGEIIGWEMGFAIGAIHFQRDYRGGMFTVFRDAATS